MKRIFKIFIVILILPIFMFASSSEEARIGSIYYDTLESAIKIVNEGEIIYLVSNVVLDNTYLIDKSVSINLNNHSIKSESTSFKVNGGKLYLLGSGSISETKPDMGVISLVGSTSGVSDYSVLEVGEDITLNGWSGVFITHSNGKSYGVKAIINGSINAVNDYKGGTGIGVYINGNIKDIEYSPIVVINKGANIKSTGNGLYQAGFTNTTINECYIEGNEASIAIKSGKLTINGGEFVSNGVDNTPTNTNNNGVNRTGVVLQIESNYSYKGNMEILITDGKFKSKNSCAIYEYTSEGDTLVNSFLISGGTFNSKKDNFNLSSSFISKLSPFISGGTFSSDVSEYLKSTYKLNKEGNNYKVIKSVSASPIESTSNKGFPVYAYILLISGVLIIVVYFIRKYYINRKISIKL